MIVAYQLGFAVCLCGLLVMIAWLALLTSRVVRRTCCQGGDTALIVHHLLHMEERIIMAGTAETDKIVALINENTAQAAKAHNEVVAEFEKLEAQIAAGGEPDFTAVYAALGVQKDVTQKLDDLVADVVVDNTLPTEGDGSTPDQGLPPNEPGIDEPSTPDQTLPPVQEGGAPDQSLPDGEGEDGNPDQPDSEDGAPDQALPEEGVDPDQPQSKKAKFGR